MRKKSLIDALFPKARQEVLSALLLEPRRSWYLSDLAAHLGRSPSSLQRELDSLVAAEILSRREDGNRVYFQANLDCPIYPELSGLLAKTTGLIEILKKALKPLAPRLVLAFVHGSVARREERATSDVDMVVVGDVGLAELSPALRPVEETFGRAANAATFAPAEFAAKVAARNHFLTTVLGREKVFLYGDEHVLEQLIASRKSATPRNEPGRVA